MIVGSGVGAGVIFLPDWASPTIAKLKTTDNNTPNLLIVTSYEH